MKEACTRAVYFVHLFNETQTYSTFKTYMSIFSYTVSLFSLYVYTDIAMIFLDSVISTRDLSLRIELDTVAFLVCPSTAQVVMALIITLIKS